MQENENEIIQMQEIQKAISAALQGLLKNSKKETVYSYKILDKYAVKGQILFVGSSLMEFFPINEMQQTLE